MSYDLSEFILIFCFAAQETFLIITVENCTLMKCGNHYTVTGFLNELKVQHLFEIEIFCNIIVIFFINLMHPCQTKAYISLKKILKK